MSAAPAAPSATAQRPARRAALLAAAALLLLPAGCVYRVSERHLFHPQRIPAFSEAVARRNVSVRAADGTTLRGWHLAAPGNRRAILYFYGNGETVFEASPTLYRLAELHGADVLAVDYRGYGWSDGEPSLAGIAADAPLLYDALAGLAPPGVPLFVFGRSLGSVFALRTALERPVAGVILQAPPSTIRELVAAWGRSAPWYVRPFVRLRPDAQLGALHPQPVEDAARLAAPLLVVHGDRDRAIPIALGRALYEQAASARKSFCEVAGGDHNDVDVLRGPAAVCIGRFLQEVDPR